MEVVKIEQTALKIEKPKKPKIPLGTSDQGAPGAQWHLHVPRNPVRAGGVRKTYIYEKETQDSVALQDTLLSLMYEIVHE